MIDAPARTEIFWFLSQSSCLITQHHQSTKRMQSRVPQSSAQLARAGVLIFVVKFEMGLLHQRPLGRFILFLFILFPFSILCFLTHS